MAKIHITLQGKGGVGKSFISAATAQYKHHKGQAPLCIVRRQLTLPVGDN
jgi:anion-transporting  ArsA/GET3 family ATPase